MLSLMMNREDLINDGLHVLWGIWIVTCVQLFPLWLVPMLAVIPREMEQTWHALPEKSVGMLKLHMDRSWWIGKIRDLTGFLIGGTLIWLSI